MTGYVTRTAVCPDCDADLEQEGFEFWCPRENKAVPFTAAVLLDHDDDPDRGTDDN